MLSMSGKERNPHHTYTDLFVYCCCLLPSSCSLHHTQIFVVCSLHHTYTDLFVYSCCLLPSINMFFFSNIHVNYFLVQCLKKTPFESYYFACFKLQFDIIVEGISRTERKTSHILSKNHTTRPNALVVDLSFLVASPYILCIWNLSTYFYALESC